MFWKLLPVRIFLVWLFLVAMIGLVFYLVVFRGANASVTQQILDKQKVLVRAEASNISSFFQAFSNSVALLAQRDSIKNHSAKASGDMDVFVEQWRSSGVVGGVILVDSQGRVQLNANVLGTHDVGMSMADRDYFSWAKTNPQSGQYFVGQPVISRLGPTKGQTIVPVASPVYKNGVFNGVVVASVKIHPLTQNYLELMKVSDVTEIYLISKQGELLYSNSLPADSTGLDIFQSLKDNPFSGSQTLSGEFKNALNKAGEGSLKAAYLSPKTGKIEEHLLAYSPISLGSQNWLLVMASPSKEVTGITVPIYLRLTALMILIFISIFFFGIISVREIRNQKSL